MSQFTIEKNIPIPQKSSRDGLVATLCKMEVGDSLLVTDLKYPNIYNSRKRAQHKSGFVFVTRPDGDGCRIWRAE